MKRSEINQAIRNAIQLLEKYQWKLPEFGYWKPEDWKKHADELENLKKVMLGWDVTDFGSGDFIHTGAVLFTLRNGVPGDASWGTPFAEKLIIVQGATAQRLPMHCHRMKTEDIINRAGGVLEMKLYASASDGTLDSDAPVSVRMDGLMHTFPAGTVLRIPTGCSVTLTPGIYHSFWAAEGEGDLIAGEVSSINDDNTDNYFVEERDRYIPIEEDEPAQYILCNE